MNKVDVFRAILICDEQVTGKAKSVLASLEKMHIETFKTSELIVDVTEHELVPKHEVLTPEQKRIVLSRYNLKDNQLPRILIDDVIARYFGLARGQVVKIVRASETAGCYVTYRIVV